MAKPHEIPSFVCPDFVEAEIAGRTLRFYAISAPVQMRLMQRLGAPIAKAIDAVLSDTPAAERQAAIAELVEAAGKNASMVAEIVLDSLHDEPWADRPVKPGAQTEAFLAKVDGAPLMAMLAAVVAANVKGFRPFKALLAGLGQSVSGSQPTPTAGDAT